MCYREERQWGCRRKLHKLEGSAGSFASMVQLEQHGDLHIHSDSKDCHSSAAGSRKATSPPKINGAWASGAELVQGCPLHV